MKKVVLTSAAIFALIVLVLLVAQSPRSLPAEASPTRPVSESISTRPAAAESTPIPASDDVRTRPPLVWLIVADREILATTLGYSNAFVAVEPIDLPPDLPPITLTAGSQMSVRIDSKGIMGFQARAQARTTSYDQVFNAPILPLADEIRFDGNQTLFTLGPISETGELRLDIPITFTSDREGSAHYAWPLHVTPTASVVKPDYIGELPSIPHDLLFLEQEDLILFNQTTGTSETPERLIRWNHRTGQLETLSSDVTCYWVSIDRRKVVLEIAKGGDIFEIALLDHASGRQTSLVETTSRIIDLAISPDGKWAAYIQSETLPDGWYCKPNLVNFDMYPFIPGGQYSGTVFSVHLSASQEIAPESPVELGHCRGSDLLGFCGRVLWSPDSRSILWSDVEGVWSFELSASQARLVIPQKLNQPDAFDNRLYFPWRWSPTGRYALSALLIYEGVFQVVIDTKTGHTAEVPGSNSYQYSGSAPAWMRDGRLFTIRPSLPREYLLPPAAIEIWRVEPQQPDMLVLENSYQLDVVWDQVPTVDPVQLEDGRLAFAVLSRDNGDYPARGLYFADPARLMPQRVNDLPPSLSEVFYFASGIIWSPDGKGAILQDWSEHPMLLYAPTDGGAVYDLSVVIQGCCFTWLR